MTTISTGSPGETVIERERRVDALLREMVVEEALVSFAEGRPPRGFGLVEIGDFCGCDPATVKRMEDRALQKIKVHVLQWRDHGRRQGAGI